MAQNGRRKEYIERFKDVAIREMNTYGIPASITLAQGILESGDGSSRLAKEANNHFGIKCHLDWNGKKIYHDDDEKQECFRVYRDPEESYRDHSLFLTERSRYADLFKLKRTDYKGWAHGLKKAGYATNPQYAKQLIKLIEENNLHLFDLAGAGELESDQPLVLLSDNHVKYVVASEGESWESISEKVHLKVSRLLKYNDRQFDQPLQAGELIYLQRKRKKGAVSTYTVKEGEDMHTISQKMAIRLEYLYRRNRMKAGEQPKPGEVLLLRGYKD